MVTREGCRSPLPTASWVHTQGWWLPQLHHSLHPRWHSMLAASFPAWSRQSLVLLSPILTPAPPGDTRSEGDGSGPLCHLLLEV